MKRSSIACLVVLSVLPVFAITSYAQISKHSALTVQVPFEFVVGNQTFPAGIYKFRSLLNSVPSQASVDVLEVRSMVGRLYSAIVTDVVGSSEPLSSQRSGKPENRQAAAFRFAMTKRRRRRVKTIR